MAGSAVDTMRARRRRRRRLPSERWWVGCATTLRTRAQRQHPPHPTGWMTLPGSMHGWQRPKSRLPKCHHTQCSYALEGQSRPVAISLGRGVFRVFVKSREQRRDFEYSRTHRGSTCDCDKHKNCQVVCSSINHTTFMFQRLMKDNTH
jgi:hypothetical protein